MKAIAKTSPAPGVEVIETPIPEVGDGELLVRVGACGICGSDLHIVDWELGANRMVGRIPFVLGHEPAGRVVQLRGGARGLRNGGPPRPAPFAPCARRRPRSPRPV